MPRGTPQGKPSEQTQRLLDALADIEDRLRLERKRDAGRAMLTRFVAKHQLTASDLRDAAKQMVARTVGDAPVVTRHLAHGKKLALGRRLRAAREAKGIPSTHLGKLIGAKGTAAVNQWESGMLPTLQKYRDALSKHLELPKDFWDDAAPTTKRGAHGNQRKGPMPKKTATNGAAHA